jgi:hypothetical protein
MIENDPLWRLRHALTGVALALLLSVPAAALAGRALGDLLGGGYGMRVAIYGGLLVYLVAGAAVLVARVAPHEKQPLTAARVVRWLATIWLWPVLLAVARRRPPAA